MIRNLLYSICLHLLFFLLLIFSDKINVIVNNEVLNISILNIDTDFIKNNDLNKIKTSKSDLYSELTLEEKIKLYKMTKGHNSSQKNTLSLNNSNFKKGVKEYINNSDKFKTNSNGIGKRDKIYLGPTDYAKFKSKSEEQFNKERELERLKIEDERANKEREDLEKSRIEQQKVIEEARLKKILEEEKKKFEKEEEFLKEQIRLKSIESERIKKEEDENKLLIESIETTENLSIDNGIKNNNLKVTNESSIDEYKLDIDINKIFTKDDLKKIREIMKDAGDEYLLSLREKLNIQNQIRTCYKNAILESGKNSPVSVSVNLHIFKDGIINTSEIKVKIIDEENKYSQEDYDISIQNAKLAIKYCNPLRNLPIIKYNTWQNISFIFDNNIE